MNRTKVKSVFISDIHIGSSGCHAKEFLQELKRYEFENLYIIGDFFDFWVIRGKNVNWSSDHTHLVQHILKRSKNGTEVYYIPGNHDDVIRNYIGFTFDSINICDRMVYETVLGEKFLITHGDEFDPVVTVHPWLAKFASKLYDPLITLNRWINKFRVARGKKPWSLSKYLKFKVKNIVNFVSSFEYTMLKEADQMGLTGVICGHIHQPKITTGNGFTYMNCGDAVENLTFIVEHEDGQFELVDYQYRLDNHT